MDQSGADEIHRFKLTHYPVASTVSPPATPETAAWLLGGIARSNQFPASGTTSTS
jgi:hypothetical protein